MLFIKKGFVIVMGSILLSVGINYFLVPYKILDGGIIGIGLIIKYLFGLKTGLTIICLSIPIFTIAWFKYKSYFYNSLPGILISSFFIDILQPISHKILFMFDAAISAIIGGALIGLGFGLMLKFKTSTGGIDLLALLISDFTGVNVGLLILITDAIVISIGGFLFSTETFFLSAISILSGGIITSICNLKGDQRIAY
ncbi:YitT family protein [Ferdinandcohnia quinoae]|uniref:YitT family protein n=1 Tax=Fredinandcohnia quinoae TaxID=2918902 RepID=A0AAW5DYX7_9BACI|nr:YitT family protein [Fredinandcohnia sp. SECRCQ15]MCH1624215.1 YitT family protein [Fredinandcohnia sp. SECRCQ15]